MAQMVQKPVLKIGIGDNCVCTQHLVCVGDVKIYLIEVGPSGGLVAERIEHCGECRNWRLAKEFNDLVGTSYFILDVEMELFQICGPLMMVVILQFSLCLHELQRLMISVDDCLLPDNVMPPLEVVLNNGAHLFLISRALMNET
jgi:hypothetical protein